MRNYHHRPYRPRLDPQFAQPLTPPPPPRQDVIASHVFIQTWQHKEGATRKGLTVLALDEYNADVQGGIRLACEGNDAREWRCVENREVTEPSLELIMSALGAEDEEEREHREASYRRREEPREPNPNGVSFDEQMDYRAMQERRR